MIDVQRLATDAGYWDECRAPEDATHYNPGSEDSIASWWHVPDGCELPKEGLIPRPQSKWVDGLPPAGTKCECFYLDLLSGKKQWIECDVIGPYGDYVICAPNGGGFYGFDAHELRPIPTKAQRDREELKRLIADYENYGHDYVTDKIIAAGWAKP